MPREAELVDGWCQEEERCKSGNGKVCVRRNERFKCKLGMHLVLPFEKATSLPRGFYTTAPHLALPKGVPSIELTFKHSLESGVRIILPRFSRWSSI